jgi:hypothetical protein
MPTGLRAHPPPGPSPLRRRRAPVNLQLCTLKRSEKVIEWTLNICVPRAAHTSHLYQVPFGIDVNITEKQDTQPKHGGKQSGK